MVTMNLTTDDVAFLKEHLGRHAKHVESELAHTDTRSMQRDLARELAQLEAIIQKLEPIGTPS